MEPHCASGAGNASTALTGNLDIQRQPEEGPNQIETVIVGTSVGRLWDRDVEF